MACQLARHFYCQTVCEYVVHCCVVFLHCLSKWNTLVHLNIPLSYRKGRTVLHVDPVRQKHDSRIRLCK